MLPAVWRLVPGSVRPGRQPPAARLVYDELQGRLEWLGSTELDEVHQRVYAAVELALDALDAAGSGPSPLGTYGPLP
jgi:hypothetical protein